MSLRRLAATLLILSALSLSGVASAQGVPSALADPGPGLGFIAARSPQEPVDVAKALESRTDVANAKLPVYPQAAKDPKRPGPPGGKPATPPGGKPAAAAPPATSPR
jgi:hypothetical protein